MFQPFWQADHAPARKAQGLGLGLAIAKRLVELHGGAIAVQSEGPGKGTTFIVRLPVASAVRAVEAPAPARPVARRERPLAGVALLVVEDEMDSRDLLQHILEDAGAHVTAVGDGQTALALLGQTRFDALVSDIGMPEMNGLELLRKLGEDPNRLSRPAPPPAPPPHTPPIPPNHPSPAPARPPPAPPARPVAWRRGGGWR